MNIYKIVIMFLLSTSAIGLANQINMSNVRTVTEPVKSEAVRQDEGEEQDLDEPVDFETEGELSKEDTSLNLLQRVALQIVAPFFHFYNWLQKKD